MFEEADRNIGPHTGKPADPVTLVNDRVKSGAYTLLASEHPVFTTRTTA